MSHLTKALIGTAAAACLALAGCGTGGTLGAKNRNKTQGMSQDNLQRYKEWHASNVNDEWWDSKVIYHPEANVYFDPYTQLYYYPNEDGTFTESPTLPSQFTLLRATRRVVTRRSILKSSGMSEDVMAFNPSFQPFEEQLDPVLQTAEGQVDYSDYKK